MLVTAQWVYMINCRSSDSFSLSMGLLRNKGIWLVTGVLLLMQLVIIYVPLMQSMFGTEALPLRYWFVTLVIGVAMFLGGGNREASDAPVPQNGLNNLARLAAGALLSQGSSMIKTFRFALLACGLVGGALTATAAPAVPVRVATVELAPHAEERAIPGRVEAIRAVDIRARTEGVIVQRHFRDGQYVTEGDLLFTLDDAQPARALALAQAELKSALITSVAAVAHSLRAAYQQPLHQPQRRRYGPDAARRRRRCRTAGQSPRRGPADCAQLHSDCGAGDRSRGP